MRLRARSDTIWFQLSYIKEGLKRFNARGAFVSIRARVNSPLITITLFHTHTRHSLNTLTTHTHHTHTHTTPSQTTKPAAAGWSRCAGSRPCGAGAVG